MPPAEKRHVVSVLQDGLMYRVISCGGTDIAQHLGYIVIVFDLSNHQ